MIYSKPYFLNADAQKEKFARAQEVYSEREEFQKRKKRDEERKHKQRDEIRARKEELEEAYIECYRVNELIKQQKLQEREKRQKESKREAAEKVRSQVKKFQMKIDYWRDKLHGSLPPELENKTITDLSELQYPPLPKEKDYGQGFDFGATLEKKKVIKPLNLSELGDSPPSTPTMTLHRPSPVKNHQIRLEGPSTLDINKMNKQLVPEKVRSSSLIKGDSMILRKMLKQLPPRHPSALRFSPSQYDGRNEKTSMPALRTIESPIGQENQRGGGFINIHNSSQAARAGAAVGRPRRQVSVKLGLRHNSVGATGLLESQRYMSQKSSAEMDAFPQLNQDIRVAEKVEVSPPQSKRTQSLAANQGAGGSGGGGGGKLPNLKPKVYKDTSDPFKPPKFIINPNKKEKKLISKQLKQMFVKQPDPPKLIDYGKFIDHNQRQRLSLADQITSSRDPELDVLVGPRTELLKKEKPQLQIKLKKNDAFSAQLREIVKHVNLSPLEVEKLKKVARKPGEWQGFTLTKQYVEQWKKKERQKQYYKRRIVTDFKPRVDESKSFEIELRKEADALLKRSKHNSIDRIQLKDIVNGHASMPHYFSNRQ